MAIDTFFVFSGVYPDTESATADYDAIKALHTEADLIDAYDAAVIERRKDGKVKIVKKHETPTRVGGVLGGGARRRHRGPRRRGRVGHGGEEPPSEPRPFRASTCGASRSTRRCRGRRTAP